MLYIKPCPFCGGVAFLEEGVERSHRHRFKRRRFTRVCCESCGASSKRYYRSVTAAEDETDMDEHECFVISMWNRRTDPDRKEGIT